MGLSMCLPGSTITLKDGIVEKSNFGDFTVARITDTPEFDVRIVPSAEAPTGMGSRACRRWHLRSPTPSHV